MDLFHYSLLLNDLLMSSASMAVQVCLLYRDGHRLTLTYSSILSMVPSSSPSIFHIPTLNTLSPAFLDLLILYLPSAAAAWRSNTSCNTATALHLQTLRISSVHYVHCEITRPGDLAVTQSLYCPPLSKSAYDSKLDKISHR